MNWTVPSGTQLHYTRLALHAASLWTIGSHIAIWWSLIEDELCSARTRWITLNVEGIWFSERNCLHRQVGKMKEVECYYETSVTLYEKVVLCLTVRLYFVSIQKQEIFGINVSNILLRLKEVFLKTARTELTYLLTPWGRVLLEKLTGLQLVKKFPAFHGTRRFITTLTSFRHLSLSWASPIHSIYPQPTSWRSILILSTHLRLGLPIGLLTSGFPSKTLYTHSPHP